MIQKSHEYEHDEQISYGISPPSELFVRSAVADGEIVCLDRHGKSQFRDLMFRHGVPRFTAFDLLRVDGEDLRYLPLIQRKLRLRSILPPAGRPLSEMVLVQSLFDLPLLRSNV